MLIGDSNYAPDHEDALVQAMLGRRPDAIVLTGTVRSRKARALLARVGVPVVETWNLTANPIDLCVGFSNHAAVPTREIGTVTVELVLARLAGREIQQRIVDLGYRFIQRESA